MKTRIVTGLLIVCAIALSSYSIEQTTFLQRLIQKYEVYSEKNYMEKVFVHTDADLYHSGDMLWMNVRTLNAETHQPSKLSRIAHVQLFNEYGGLLQHKKVKIEKGHGKGDLYLSDTLSTGNYYLLGYTEWMRNYPEEFLFKKRITIINKHRVIDEQQKEAQVEISFFPEGGHLVADQTNNVGFQVFTNSNSPFVGTLVDDVGDSISTIAPYKFGIGSFDFAPERNRKYFIKHDGKSFKLPPTSDVGMNLTVLANNELGLRIRVNVTKDEKKRGRKIFVVAHHRGKIQFAAEGPVKTSEIQIPAEKLGVGINHVSLFNNDGLPIEERLIFVQPTNSTQLKTSLSKKTYGRRNKVELEIGLDTLNGGEATVSVQNNPFNPDDIISHLLLTSDIAGDVENPWYYFENSDSARQAADNLMLTHGWRRFSWEEVLADSLKNKNHLAESSGVVFRCKFKNQKTGELVKDTLLTLAVNRKDPNITFSESFKDEHIFPLSIINGRNELAVSIVDNTSFSDYSLSSSEEYAPVSINITEKSELPEKLDEYVATQNTELRISTMYKSFDPSYESSPLLSATTEYYPNRLGRPFERIEVDEFEALDNLDEMITELVRSAITKKKKGKNEVFVLNNENFSRGPSDFHKQPATAMLNGVPVYDNRILFDLDPNKIKRLETYIGQFSYGGNSFDGLFAVTTNNNGEQTLSNPSGSNKVIFDGIALTHEWYAPNYQLLELRNKKSPDLRHLLYWNSNLILGKGETKKIEFYTSDILDEYIVKIEGLTNDGQPFAKRITFKVSAEN